jgi:meso-butanediol dehydrogenase / (S,S)-butanediol dehydrogenase / diacetyl reductase
VDERKIMGKLDGKIAIVTGAGLGQGRSTALKLASEGATVIAADFSGAEKDTAAEMPDSITPFQADVTRASDIEALVAEATHRYGRLDVLCNVVGVAGVAQALIPDIEEDDLDKLMAINFKSCFFGMKYAIPVMVANGGGSIVNWSSVGALRPMATTGIYSATKAGVIALTKTAAVEWAKDKVRVNAICPGYIYPTGMTLMGQEKYPETANIAANAAPMKRPGHPDEIAAVAAFLASDESSFMTGEYVIVDGGKTAGQT